MPMYLPGGKSISKSDVVKMQKRISSLQSRAKNAIAKTESVVGEAVQTLEIGATAFALGVAKGRYGPVDIAGIPVDLGMALGLHAVAFVSDSEMSDHMHSFANGAMASYLADLGGRIGAKMALKAASPEPGEEMSGGPPMGTDTLHRDDLNRI